ncbi:MAG: hypothetical protein ABIP41_06600 [Croceibacterium sp.]
MIARLRSLLLTAGLAAAGMGLAPAAAERSEPLPRFEDAMCPGVAGLTTEAAELMVGRIRQNAQALGRRMAPADSCEPNVIVAFVDDGRAVLRQMNRAQGYLFAEMNRTERAALFAEGGPVHVLSRVFTRTRDGLPVYRRDSLTDLPQTTMAMAHSKIYTATRRDIVHALVLVDRAAVRGLSVNQLADYATVRALVHRPPEAATIGAPSILALFAAGQGARPAGLTAFDNALLTSLYQGLPNMNGTATQATIAHATGRKVEVE